METFPVYFICQNLKFEGNVVQPEVEIQGYILRCCKLMSAFWLHWLYAGYLIQVKTWLTAGDSTYIKCNVLAAAASVPWESPTDMWSLVENLFKHHTGKYSMYHYTYDLLTSFLRIMLP